VRHWCPAAGEFLLVLSTVAGGLHRWLIIEVQLLPKDEVQVQLCLFSSFPLFSLSFFFETES
jgi:hypothetical protein